MEILDLKMEPEIKNSLYQSSGLRWKERELVSSPSVNRNDPIQRPQKGGERLTGDEEFLGSAVGIEDMWDSTAYISTQVTRKRK